MANLSPYDVRNVAFNKPPLGRRGYDEDEVDRFLDEVERTLTALYREIEQLRAGGGNEPEPTGTPPASPVPVSGGLPGLPGLGGSDPGLGGSDPGLPGPPWLPGHDPVPPAGAMPDAVRAEIDLIKQRLTRIEHTLSERPGF